MKPLEGFMHGVNLGGWLSQCNYEKNHCDSFITEKDIAVIKSWGLDHIRLPVDYNLFQNKDGTFIEDGFDYVQNCIDWCKKNNLNMILDLHKTAGYSFDADEKEVGLFDDNSPYQNRFIELWIEFAKRFSKYEEMLCFELLNEVTSPSFCKPWNALAKKCIKSIREIAPTIKILVGSYWNNSISAIKDLDPPYDENIVYNFHCYEPFVFTHQGAGWLGGNMNKDFRIGFDVTYKQLTQATTEKLGANFCNFSRFNQESSPDYQYFENHFAEALKIAEERNVTLYCGEYGVIDNAKTSDIIKWYSEIKKVFDSHNIGRAAWSYKKMNFGISDYIFDEESKAQRNDLIKLL
ncbi:MAG: glycoside hydrolase family 5 protein [Treponema sp.]|nr:glycoside hydrolase family 5 protein [Treponema sp.]